MKPSNTRTPRTVAECQWEGRYCSPRKERMADLVYAVVLVASIAAIVANPARITAPIVERPATLADGLGGGMSGRPSGKTTGPDGAASSTRGGGDHGGS